jgi:hypothetical protein
MTNQSHSATIRRRTDQPQAVAAYTGNGGYSSSPDDNCSSIHLIRDGAAQMVAESYPSTIMQYLARIA